MKQRRATRSEAHIYLSAAMSYGWISGFEELPDGRWLLQVPPTRYEAYHKTAEHGVIALTHREVYAFIEGCWAGSKTNPTTRAGHRYD